jgi:TP901 family phage tail tape measure protein
MADVNANIGVSIDTSAALAQLKALQRQISQFHSSIARSSESAALAQKSLQKNLIGSINSIGAFSAELRTVRTSAESFTNSLEKNKFSMREYFRYAGASTKTFGRLFKSEFDTIGKVAQERVKTLQTQYIKMGRNASGAMEAIAIRPTSLNMQDYGTRTAIAAQKQALFNQLMKQGTTNLLNFGKNTQWAGRQLMVGFTIPLAVVGSTATKTFMDMEAQALKFRKVYGDLFTPKAETQAALDNITELGRQFTKYGISVSQTVGLAAEAAAAGFQGLDLQRQTTEATRLSVLGQVDSQKALETTISLQNAFGMSSDKLADSINFLNAVENQTVVSLDDITTAIPKVAPVIQQLGGDVKDLTFFIAAMKEGGINASEGANALKSGLAALINPTRKASDMLANFGINAREIVVKNKGDLKTTVIEFATALNQLDPLNRAQAIEQMFGKFQFARLSTLFANVAKDGNQAARVLDLANSSVQQLSDLSEQELGMTADSAMNKFKKSVEDLKFALIPVGQAFLEAATPIIEFVGGVLEKFGNLSDGTKKLITFLTVGIGAIGPIFLMTFGLIANAIANGLKVANNLRQGYLRLTGQSQILGEQTQYLNTEQLEAAAAAHSLDQSHAKLTQSFTAETAALQKLIAAYQSAARAGQSFMFNNPGMMMPPRGGRKLASGIVSVPGPKGAGDIFPAMLSPGEAVIPAKFVEKYGPLIEGMVAGNIPGYEKGRTGTQGTNVKIPGGFAAAHFGGSSSMTGNELLSSLEGRTDKVALSLKKMVESMENADGPLTVFTNEVVAMSADLNEALGKTGSGKKASAQLARQELTTGTNAQVRDIELQRQLEKASVPIEEIKIINKKLTDEITIGFEKLGNITEITAEGVDDLISTAYKKVAETDKRVDAALNKMKKVTTVTDPNLLTRRPITKESYKEFRRNKKSTGTSPYYQGMERMVGAGNVPFSKEAAFRITNPMAEGLGMSSAEAKIIYDKFSKETKITLSKLRGDLNAFTAEFTAEAAKVGSKVGASVVSSTASAAGTASPSKKTNKIGQDIARGLEVGMADRQDDVARVGANLGKAATGGVKGAVGPIPFRGPGQSMPGVKYSTVEANAPMSPQISGQVKETAKGLKSMNDRLRTLDRGLMTSSFAISSLAGVASMSGGKLGEMSGSIFKVTTAMFALQAVTSLLTQSGIARLATDRGLGAGLLVQNIATKKAGVNTTLFSGGIKKLLPNLLKFGGMIARFLGPIGLVVSGLLGMKKIIDMVNSAKEKERLKIEGLGDAATLTSNKLKTLGDFFGVKTGPSPFERLKTQKSEIQVGTKQRSEIEELRGNKEFQKEFKNDISTLETATKEQAQLIFESIAVQLKGSGFANEQIDNIIKALQLEANKTSVKIDLKNIDLTTEAGQAKLNSNIKTLTDSIGVNFNKGMKTTFYSVVEDGRIIAKPFTELGDEAKKSIDFASKAITTNILGLSAQLESGVIDAKQFSSAFESISNNIRSMPKPQSIALMSNLMKSLPEDLVKSAQGISNVSHQLLLLQGQAAGVAVSSALINAMLTLQNKGAESMERRAAVDVINDYKDSLKGIQELWKGLNNTTDPFKNVSTPQTGPQQANRQLSIIQNYFSAKEALIKQERQLEEDALQASIDGTQKRIDDEQKLIDTNQRSIDLLNRRIDLEYDRPIQKLQDESTILGNNLDIIRKQEDAINSQYNKQIQSLEKISSINQEIAGQEKSRLTIADALTSGDIAAAAAAVQDARAQAAASRIDQQTKALEVSRQQALTGITAGGMTKDQIEARTYAIGQQVFSLEQQRKTLQDQIVVLQDKNYETEESIYKIKNDTLITQQEALEKYQKSTTSLIEGQLVLGKTQKEWVTAEGKVNLYNAALDLSNGKLDGMDKLLTSIAKKWATLQSGSLAGLVTTPEGDPTVTGASKVSSGIATSTGSTVTVKSGNTLSGIAKAAGVSLSDVVKANPQITNPNLIKPGQIIKIPGKMYGGKIENMNMGGMVPKYFANGGRMGSDTVPAMLTPGEFVMNKQATKSFGPLLSMLNESKYPSMIGSSYDGKGSSGGIMTSVSDNSSKVYNYNVGITVPQSNANPNDIARAVIGQIKYIDNQRIRGQR